MCWLTNFDILRCIKIYGEDFDTGSAAVEIYDYEETFLEVDQLKDMTHPDFDAFVCCSRVYSHFDSWSRPHYEITANAGDKAQ